jgi:dTDP-glucose pyrophosphorylase
MKYLNKKKLNNFFLKPNVKIKDVIKNLTKSNLQIALIVKNKDQLIGTITDGDIRRGFLSGLKINNSAMKIINRKPIVSYKKQPKDLIQYSMQNNVILQMPHVDKNQRIKGLYVLQDYVKDSKIENPILILAGGRGKRMMPYTKKLPKPMIKINGKPILEHIIIGLKNQGFKNIFISINYLAEKIEKYFKDGSSLGVNIKYLRENKPLGTGGPLGNLKKHINLSEDVFVINGDILSNLDLKQMLNYHKKNNSDATMASIIFEMQNPYGVIKTKLDKIIGFKEKPISQTHINAGIYIINAKLLKFIKINKKTHITSLFNFFIKKKLKTYVYPIHEFWNEIGDKKKYEQLIQKK